MGKGSGKSSSDKAKRQAREDWLRTNPIDAREFAVSLKQSVGDHAEISYVLLLGAGCSKSSGIPLASELVRDHWMPKLLERKKHLPIGEREIPDYDPENPGAYYSKAVAKLFPTGDRQQTEFKRVIGDAQPYFGYYILSELMDKRTEQFNTVLTTNFDNLLAEALTFFHASRPLVIHHSQLITMAHPERDHPSIIKLHNDVFFAPRNTSADLEHLTPDLITKVVELIKSGPLIIMGYSGNDKTVLELLEACDAEMEVYWVASNLPQDERFRSWLTSDKVKAQWVNHRDFDSLMLEIADVFEMKGEPDHTKVIQRLDKVTEDYKKARSGMIQHTREAEAEEGRSSEGAMAYLAYQQAMENPDDGDRVFGGMLRTHPKSTAILGSYALFLETQDRMKDAGDHFRLALKADPEHAITLGNYAVFLKRQDRMEEAGEYYRRALKADPENAYTLSNYADFLAKQDRMEEAEEHCRRALKADPEHVSSLGNYIELLFLTNRAKEGEAKIEKLKGIDSTDKSEALLGINLIVFALHMEHGDKSSLSAVKELVMAGHRSATWDFDKVIIKAKQAGNPYIAMISDLADVINEKQEPSILEKYEAWKEA